MKTLKRNYFSITIALLVGLLLSGPALSQAKKVEYDNNGKPLASTRGEFIVKQSVNLRSGLGADNQVIGVLPTGATVMVKEAVHGYYKITFDGKTGYSWHKFFTPK